MKKVKPAPVKRRNPLHDALYLSKCSAHGTSKKAKRKIDKVALKREWFSQWVNRNVPIDKTIYIIMSA